MPFNTKIFDVLFKKLVVWLLPMPIRKPVHVAWLMAMLSPLTKLYNDFLAFRTSVLYYLNIDASVCKLEKLLNDRYDTVQRRIVITDPQEFDPLWLYRKVENKPVFLFRKSENKPVFLYTKAETSAFGVDFIIKIPVFVVFDINELKSLIKRFRLGSKTFKVQII
jgi:hypothetical protein